MTFDSIDSFRKRLRRHLASWTLSHENGLLTNTYRGLKPFQELSTVPGEYSSTTVLENVAALTDLEQLTDAETTLANAVANHTDPRSINRYGHFLMRLGRLDQAEVIYTWALQLDLPPEHAAKSYGNLGVVYRLRGDLAKAEEMQRRALSLNRHLGNSSMEAASLLRLGVIYTKKEDSKEALNFFSQALKVYSETGNLRGMATAHGNIGTAHSDAGALSQAIEAHGQALHLNKKIANKPGLINDYTNMGNIYQQKGDLELSEKMFEHSLRISKDIEERDSEAYCLEKLGTIYMEQSRQKKEAADHLTEAYRAYVATGKPEAGARIDLLLTELDS